MFHRPREDMATGTVLAAIGIVGRGWNLSDRSGSRFFFDAIGRYLEVGESRQLLAFRALEDRFRGGGHARILPAGRC